MERTFHEIIRKILKKTSTSIKPNNDVLTERRSKETLSCNTFTSECRKAIKVPGTN